MEEQELHLDDCDECMQMTNHLGDDCQKCNELKEDNLELIMKKYIYMCVKR